MPDPTTIYGTLFWGVVAGVLTSGFLVLCGLVVSRLVVPWYQQLVYRGIDLSGHWTGERFDEQQNATYTFNTSLKQSAHNLTGTVTKTKSGSGTEDYVHVFLATGTTRDGFAMLNLESADPISFSLGTALLKILKTGAQLQGFLLYRGRNNDTVEIEEVKWVRRS